MACSNLFPPTHFFITFSIGDEIKFHQITILDIKIYFHQYMEIIFLNRMMSEKMFVETQGVHGLLVSNTYIFSINGISEIKNQNQIPLKTD